MKALAFFLALPLLVAQEKPFRDENRALARQDVGARLKRDGWRAVRETVARGESARGVLQAAVSDGDPETAFYGRAALAELDAISSGVCPAVPLTRSRKGPAGEIAASLFRSAGLKSQLSSLPRRDVTLAAGLSFAEALDRLSRELDVEFQPEAAGAWRSRNGFQPVPRFARGRVLARLESVMRFTNVPMGRKRSGSLRYEGKLLALGRFADPPLFTEMRVLEARDGSGLDLRTRDEYEAGISTPDESVELSGGFAFSVKPPRDGSDRVALVRLAADFLFPSRRGEITVDLASPERPVTKKAGGLEVTVVKTYWEKDELRGKDGFRVLIRLRGKGIGMCMDNAELRLLDRMGRAWVNNGANGGGGGNAFEYDFTFSDPGGIGDPERLVWPAILDLRVHSVYFEFLDLPLK